MSNKRNLTIFLVLALVAIATVVSWIAASSIKSPAEVAARTAPPTPSPILVPIEERVLSSRVVTRGTARFGLPKPISIILSALKSDVGVITAVRSRNTQLKEGDVILSASGRPAFVLLGQIPVYRDLVPGISGADVRQLETRLNRMGFEPGSIDGIYDEQTSAAVAKWYGSAGWQPFRATAEQLAGIRDLEQKLAVALNNKLAAEAAALAAPRIVDAASINAERANRSAAAEVAAKTAFRDKVVAGRGATEVQRANANAALELAQATVTAAQLTGEVEIQAAINAQKVAERQANLAVEINARLAADLDASRRRAGVQVPADEIVFLSYLPVRVEQVDVDLGDLAKGTIMTVTNNQLVIDSSLPLNIAPLVKSGMGVTIDEPSLGIKATGVVKRVADTPGTDGVDGYHVYFKILVDQTSTVLQGFSLRLTIPIESTDGTVTAVPVSAVSLAADGTSRVQVDNDGALEYVVVEPGLSADGFVEVTPVNGTLAPGQLVVIGYEDK